MNYVNEIDFTIKQCDITEAIMESNRFIFHIALVYIITKLIERDNNIFTDELLKTLLITLLAIIIYNIVFKKLVKPILNTQQNKCRSSLSPRV